MITSMSPIRIPLKQVPFGNQPAAPDAVAQQRLNDLASQYPVIDTFLKMVRIPSATPQPNGAFQTEIDHQLQKMRQVIATVLSNVGVTDIQYDPSGSMVVRIPGTPGYENVSPLMLTAHMDIVPGDTKNPTKPVNPTIRTLNGTEYIATDLTTTLGADDKGGISMILDTVARLQGRHPHQKTPLPHAPLEIIFSPDEEGSCNSLKTLDTRQFKAKHVLVVDEFKAFNFTNGLASAVNVDIELQGLPGGHSGADITKPGRLNAIMIMAEIVTALNSGPIEMDPALPGMPVISKNIGYIDGGGAYNAIPKRSKLGIALRSFSRTAQQRELDRIQLVLRQIEQKYQQQVPGFRVKLDVEEEYPPWKADPNSTLPGHAIAAGLKVPGAPPVTVGPMHAAAQASLLANMKNGYGEQFDAGLIGPNIEDAHDVKERLDWQSLVKANEWLGQIIQVYSRQAAGHGSAQP